LEILNAWYYEPKIMWHGESNPLVPPLFNHWGLDAQQMMLKLCMKNNSKVAMEPLIDFNPLNCI
jgi:hypothetical protein